MPVQKANSKKPRVSVVMPAYNAGAFIGEVIATVLGQTFRDFEFIILDDGSKDNTADIIKAYAKIDKRVKYYHQPNQGSAKLGETINTAVSYAKAEWIARADADDPWFLDKLEKQLAFIDSNPGYVLVGGGADITNERGVHLYTLLGPIDDDDNRRALTLYTTLAHGSVMFKKAVFDKTGGYKNIHSAEDLELWHRMSDYGKIHNIPEPLFRYRTNTQGISQRNARLQAETVETLGLEYFKTHTPKVMSRIELRKKLNAINSLRNNSPLPGYHVDHLLIKVVDDNLRIARLFIKNGSRSSGFMQIIHIMFSGRLGMKKTLQLVKKNVVWRLFGSREKDDQESQS